MLDVAPGALTVAAVVLAVVAGAAVAAVVAGGVTALIEIAAVEPVGAGLPMRMGSALPLVALMLTSVGYLTGRRRTGQSPDPTRERQVAADLATRLREEQVLRRAGQAVHASLDLPAVLAEVLDTGCRLFGATGGFIELVDADDLVVAAVHGVTGATVGGRRPGGSGDAEAAMRETTATSSSADLERRSTTSRGPESGLVVALRHRGALLGLLHLSKARLGDAGADQGEHHVAQFAEDAAAAVANASAHAAKAAAVAELAELDGMKDEFLALVVHELRGPLTSMIGLTSMLAQRSGRLSAERITELAGIASTEGWRLERLLGDLMRASAASRGGLALAPVPTEVVGLIDGLITAQRSTAVDHHLELDAPAVLEATVDGDVLARIVANLLGNAVKYSPAGTRIRVELRMAEGYVELTVADDGPGIAEDDRSLVFEKFRRGRAQQPTRGMGIGLYVVRALAEAHGGSAVLADQPVGCRFVVRLAELDPGPDRHRVLERNGEVVADAVTS